MTEQELDRMLDAWTAPELPASLRKPAERKRQWRPWAMAASVALVCGVAVGTSVMTKEPEVGATWAQLGDGTHLRVRTLSAPWYAAMKWTGLRGGMAAGGDRFRHCVADGALAWYTCYAARMQREGESGGYRVQVMEERLTEAELDRRGWRGARFAAMPGGTGVFAAKLDEPFQVEIRRTGPDERLWDEITLSESEFADVPSRRTLGAGPFGAAEMRLSNPRLYVNGRLMAEARMEARGLTLFFTLPGRGEWRMAVDTGGHPGFREMGAVEDGTLRFVQEGEEFRIVCDRDVTAVQGARKLYVWHRPDVRNDGSAAPFGSAGPAAMMER